MTAVLPALDPDKVFRLVVRVQVGQQLGDRDPGGGGDQDEGDEGDQGDEGVRPTSADTPGPHN